MELTEKSLKSEKVLESIKQAQRLKKIVDVDLKTTKIVVFFSGGVRYAFYGNCVKEILIPPPIFWLPAIPEYIRGLINVRGDIESVIDFGILLGAAPIELENAMIIIAEQNFFRTGIIIDSIEDVVDIPSLSIKPPLPTLEGLARELVIGIIEHNGGEALLLDIDKIAAKTRI